ncbi:hypothetical protein [Flavihumibacter petaseus]|uniref:Uncharacterized protein n=1 Tax=Flavihumibacter petaseus NBRC 106054 TaxID=1220578 RepID=A0A0E9N6U8_9BACT|nr:hypothetical protein [Flavihumibacter petaseus]GAO45672.1 hypothetical protein FPE01S_07_00600 [Flavihumibacter petaseus NBRC 106054]
MKTIFAFALLLFVLPGFAQTKTPERDRSLKLFTLNFHGKKPPVATTAPDTIAAMITVTHKIRYNKTVKFPGYITRNGKRRIIYDECWNRMPDTWALQEWQVLERPVGAIQDNP